MRAKKVAFDVTYIDLRNKPAWFLEISPHGKVPVLEADGDVLFESNAIAEYLDETVPPRLHPEDPIKRARNRAWTDFVPDFSKALSGIYYTKTRDETERGLAAARKALQRIEDAIGRERGNDGPYFNGGELCLVDAAYAPFLQRLDIADGYLRTGALASFPLVEAWTRALLASETVTDAVASNFLQEFHANLRRRGFHIASLLPPAETEGATRAAAE